MEALGLPVAEGLDQLLEGPGGSDLSFVLKGKHHQRRRLAIVVRRGEGVAERLGVRLPRLHALARLRAERREEATARDE
eukprot:7619718-Alexandrium_andersonii.AAC.1